MDNRPIDAVEFLVTDRLNKDKADMLEKKLKTLQYEHGLKPTDDLALIRVFA